MVKSILKLFRVILNFNLEETTVLSIDLLIVLVLLLWERITSGQTEGIQSINVNMWSVASKKIYWFLIGRSILPSFILNANFDNKTNRIAKEILSILVTFCRISWITGYFFNNRELRRNTGSVMSQSKRHFIIS